MNRLTRWGAALIILPMAACASNPPAPPAEPPAPPPLAAADASFVTAAAQGGMAEIQAAQLALSTSKSPKVKAYAQKMITDHTQADDQLKQIATSKSVTLPTAPNDTQMQQMTTLQGEKGRKFDHDYLVDQVADHQQQLLLMQTEASSGTDPDLKKFAADTTPIVQSHLDMATAMVKGPMHKATTGMHRHHHTS